jgi:hypothetical protein
MGAAPATSWGTMFNSSVRVVLIAACAACIVGASASASGTAGVTISPDVQRRLGVATARLSTARHASEIDAFAKALDPAPLVQLDSDLRTAESAAVASKAEAERSRVLNTAGGGIAAKDAEAATAQARADALKVQSLRRQLGLGWGPGVARLSAGQRDRLVRGLSDGSIALVHVDTHNNEGQAGARSVRIDIGSNSVTGAVIGPARTAEARLQSSGLIVEVNGRSAVLLAVGLVQSAHIATTTPQAGVMIPRGAVVRFEGSDWAYVRSGPTRFERRIVQDPIPGDDGFFVPHGFADGDEVVVQGAGALFTAEQSRAVKAD